MITLRPEHMFLKALQATRGVETFRIDDVVAGAVMLYCRRMKIACHFDRIEPRRLLMVVDKEIVSSDPILFSFRDFLWSNKVAEAMTGLWDDLCRIEDEEFEPNYAEYVDSYFKLISVFIGRRDRVEYIQPRSVTEIIAFYMKKYGVKSLYNPFAGLCSYPISLGVDCSFVAQEINPTTLALAKVRLHAHGLNPEHIELEDSVKDWKGNHYDAVVASVPFGLRVPMGEMTNPRTTITTIEDLFFLRAMGRGDRGESSYYPRKMVATIVPQSFTTRPASSRLREMMCQDGVLDTIIELPEGIFPNTSVRTSIIILNTSEKHDSVRFVNVSSCLKENPSKYRSMDWQKVISILESENSDFIKTVSFEELSHQGYILNGDNYLPASAVCEEGHAIVSLSELLEHVPGSRIRYALNVEQLPLEAFSNKVLDILHPNTSLLTRGYVDSGYSVSGPCILFFIKDRQVLAYMHNSESTIAVNRRVYALRVISDKVCPEYMAALLLKDDIFCKQMIESVAWASGSMSRAILYRRIIIALDSLQGQYLKWYETKEIAEREATDAAEKARYQINKAGGDIVHILATPFKRQNQIISTLLDMKPNFSDNSSESQQAAQKYLRRVTSLIDVCQYIRRMTTVIGGDLKKARFTMKDTQISYEIADYVRAWANFMSTTDYQVIIQDATDGDVILEIDPMMFRIALDTLIENASMHGFRDGNYTAPDGNLVCIRISPVLVDEKPFLQVSVMNNGLEAPADYNIEVFRSRGVYIGDSGHTGLGGNHVDTIAHRSGGYIAYRTEMEWPFIIDILLPVKESDTTQFTLPYEESYV